MCLSPHNKLNLPLFILPLFFILVWKYEIFLWWFLNIWMLWVLLSGKSRSHWKSITYTQTRAILSFLFCCGTSLKWMKAQTGNHQCIQAILTILFLWTKKGSIQYYIYFKFFCSCCCTLCQRWYKLWGIRNKYDSVISFQVLSIYLYRDKNKMVGQISTENQMTRSQDILVKWYEAECYQQ